MTNLLKVFVSIPFLAVVMIGLTIATIFVTVNSINSSMNIEEMSIEKINKNTQKGIDEIQVIQPIPAEKITPENEKTMPINSDEEIQDIEIIKSGPDGPVSYIVMPPLFFNTRVALAGELRKSPRCQPLTKRRHRTCPDPNM
jgi:hypothetical protein